MDIEALKTYLTNGYNLYIGCINGQSKDLFLAAKDQDFDAIENINLELAKLEAVKSFIEALYENFPELK